MAPGLKTVSVHPPSSRKRLLSDCAKPKTATSPDHSPLKKTRDLPNLTECQACGSRTDNANGKNRIQTLHSEWRIVLLCPRCYLRVDSSQICSYCFQEASDDCFSCGQCKHSLHKSCFFNYKSVPPWSYSVCGSEFTVCIDCWVPEQIARKRGILRRNKKAKISKVSEARDGEGAKLLEDIVKDANCAMEKKVEAAVKAREMAVKKAFLAKQAVELAYNALEECDDAELAFRLHREMNSSPRISKNRILCEQNSLEPLIAGSRTFSRFKPTEIVYARRRKKAAGLCASKETKRDSLCPAKHSESKEKSGVDLGMKEREDNFSTLLSNSSEVDSSMNSESKPYNYQDDSIVSKDRQSDVKLVQYLFTYSRKKSNWKENPNGKTKFPYEGYNLESQATSPQLAEPLTISTTGLQSCVFPHRASAGVSDSCQDHS
ncbi:hypothetical protein REPUB_Repub01dG0158400 [Reevesia pubescens]